MSFKSKDAISGKEGTAYLKVDGKNEELFCTKSIEAKIEIKKGSVKCIGRRMEGSKPTGMKGTGTFKFYYGFPLFSDIVKQYKETGKPLYFDMLITNSDAASEAGTQSVLIKDCSTDSVLLAKLDGDTDDPLEDEISFTFEDYEYIESFKSV